MSPHINILLSSCFLVFLGGGGSPSLQLFPAGGMELRCDFWKLGLAGEEKKVSVANGAIRVLSLSIVNNKTEQQHRTLGIGRKGKPSDPL